MPAVVAKEELITLVDAAHRLGLSYPTARDRMLRGELRGIRRGSHWYVERDSPDAQCRGDTSRKEP